MNFKKVRHGIGVLTTVGILGILWNGQVADASEIDSESPIVEVSTTEERNNLAVYSQSFGQESYANLLGMEYVYIREEPSEEGEWIGKLYQDNKVNIVGIELFAEGDWAQIESGEVSGYVELDCLLDADSTAAKQEESTLLMATVNASALNVRLGAGMEHDIVDVVKQGDLVQVMGKSGNWSLVYYDDVVGYVYNSYISQGASATTYAESREAEAIRVAIESKKAAGDDVVNYAMQFIGNPYVWGGTDLVNGADCSGFVQSVYKTFGIDLPRTSASQRSAGVEVSYDEIMRGDIVCYDGHVGIYIGDDQIVNAIGKAYGIGVSSATYSNIITIRRVL